MSVFKSLKARLSKKATPENSAEDTSATSGVLDEDSTVHGILTGDFPDGFLNTDHVATVDTAMAAPPPSPLAPVDLTDPAQVTGVMEIAARIGEILIFRAALIPMPARRCILPQLPTVCTTATSISS